MSRKITLRTLSAVAFTIALSLAGTVHATVLSESGSGPALVVIESEAGFFGQAWSWLTERWAGLTGMFAADSAPGSGGGTSSSTTSSGGCEAGWVIDPNGCPNG